MLQSYMQDASNVGTTHSGSQSSVALHPETYTFSAEKASRPCPIQHVALPILTMAQCRADMFQSTSTRSAATHEASTLEDGDMHVVIHSTSKLNLAKYMQHGEGHPRPFRYLVTKNITIMFISYQPDSHLFLLITGQH